MRNRRVGGSSISSISGKEIPRGVAQALGGAPADPQGVGDLIQGQALGGGGQKADELQQPTGFFVPHDSMRPILS